MMFLTHCVMGWMVLAVLSLCLPVWSAVNVIQPYRVVSTNGTAQVLCFFQPSYHPEELRVTLLKGLHGSQELCSSGLHLKKQKVTGAKEQGEVQCSAQLRGDAVEVSVSGLKATDTDMYRCEIKVFFPPPYLKLTGNGTLIHVLDSSDCPAQGAQIAHQGDEEEDDEEGVEKMGQVSVPVCILVILVILVLIIIIYFQALQCKQEKRETFRPMPGVCHKVDAAAFSRENMA